MSTHTAITDLCSNKTVKVKEIWFDLIKVNFASDDPFKAEIWNHLAVHNFKIIFNL